MGTTISQLSLTVFELINEFYIAMGSGPFGFIIITKHGFQNNRLIRTVAFTALTAGCFIYLAQDVTRTVKSSRNKVIFITGCDSGLGYSLAQHCQALGYTVIAGCLSLESKGARELASMATSHIRVLEMDVSKTHSVNTAVRYIERFLAKDGNNVLWAVINNAGVMVFGEFEWLTEKLIQKQLDVNIFGTMLVAKHFCPLLRKYKGRIINVTSHCAYATLPGLSVYGASKAAVQALTDGLRVELSKYGVSVISFVPGSFIGQSNIMAKHVDNVYEMNSEFTTEQKHFYGEYFRKYNAYLSAIVVPSHVRKIDDDAMYDVFKNALMSEKPKALYVHQSLKYKIYHIFFKYSPVRIRDYLIQWFVQMPAYIPRKPVSDSELT